MFDKYCSIENFDRVLRQFKNDIDLLSLQKFVIQDKIDGSNISFIFEPNQVCKICSRNQLLGSWNTCTFQGFQEAITNSNLTPFIEFFEAESSKTGNIFQFYGEIFGPNIIKRCYYGDKTKILLFDLRINGLYATQKEFMDTLIYEGFVELITHIFITRASWEEALNFQVDFQDPICTDSAHFLKCNPNNISEGIVVKPFDVNIYNKHGARFAFKKKSPMFSEVKAAKTPSIKPEVTNALIEMSNKFDAYINENRVLSYFSKVGNITEMSQLGKYIGPILADAEEDFVKDNGQWGFEERKFCMKSSTPNLVKILTSFIFLEK